MLQRITHLVAVVVALSLSLSVVVGAFTASSLSPTTSRRESSTTSLFVSRRAMLEASMTVAALGTFLTTSSSPALAEGFEDLAMPSEAEQQQQAEEAMKERLRRKAELQKAQSKPASFKESMEAERKKQDSLKKSQEERRNALCEELGRGC